MNIRWIGQSGYILRDDKTEILIDPYLSDAVYKASGKARLVEPPFAPQQVTADVVICTHDHLDHLDTDAIEAMNKDKIIFVAPSSCVAHLTKLNAKHISALDVGQTLTIGKFTITAVFAAHSVDAIGLVVKHGDKILCFTGDTLFDERLFEMKKQVVDVLFICINGKLGNMNVEEAVKVTKEIQPKTGIPTHYGMFAENTEDPAKYTSQIKNSFEMQYNVEYSCNDL